MTLSGRLPRLRLQTRLFLRELVRDVVFVDVADVVHRLLTHFFGDHKFDIAKPQMGCGIHSRARVKSGVGVKFKPSLGETDGTTEYGTMAKVTFTGCFRKSVILLTDIWRGAVHWLPLDVYRFSSPLAACHRRRPRAGPDDPPPI